MVSELMKQDRKGYYVLNKNSSFSFGGNIKVFHYDDAKYYFKSIVKKSKDSKIINIGKDYAAYRMLAEIVNPKIYRELGIDAVEYHLAKYKQHSYGVVSQDFKANYKSINLLSECGINCGLNYSLEYLKNSDFIKKQPKHFKQSLDKAVLAHYSTGQYDGHDNNIAVYSNNGEELDGVVLLDNSLCFASKFKTTKEFLECYNKNVNFVRLGIENGSEWQGEFRYGLINSPYIDKTSICEYLERLNTFLDDKNSFKTIKEEVVEEYNMGLFNHYFVPYLNEFIERQQFCMEHSRKLITDCYNQRELGDME